MDGEARATALAWLKEMQDCVRERDYARCRAIFAADVVGYGTKATVARGLDALERDQWRHVWGRIGDFTFLTDELDCAMYGDSGLWLACPGTSEASAADGASRHRPGRITAVLEWRDGRWLAVHTHHSLAPVDAGVAPD